MLVLRLAVVPLVALVFAFGVWFTGGVLTDDMDVAMALLAGWFVVAGVAALLVARARRGMMLPVFGTYVVAAAAIGGYLGYASMHDRKVDEEVAVGSQLARGGFESGAHATSGSATVVKPAGGDRVLTLTGFETSPGPDLRVYLSTDRDASDSEDLGGLKGNVGDQQYEIPAGLDLATHSTVVIWCRAFSVEFGSAELVPR